MTITYTAPDDSEQSTLPDASADASGNVPQATAKIQVVGLDAFYGRRHVLHHLSLSVPEHQVTAIMGPSGCGKSTFVKALNRMLDLVPGAVVKGQVIFDGTDIYGPDVDVVHLRQQLGMVFQHPNPFTKSVFENVAFGLRIMGGLSKSEIAARVEASLSGAALWDEVKDRLGHNALGLSGGQQQRLCIARALAVHPEVILMDEPCSALDPVATLKIEELIDQLKQQYTIVIVTHNLQQAARVSQYTGFFLLGDLIEFGPTPQIFARPRDRRTEDFVTGRFG